MARPIRPIVLEPVDQRYFDTHHPVGEVIKGVRSPNGNIVTFMHTAPGDDDSIKSSDEHWNVIIPRNLSRHEQKKAKAYRLMTSSTPLGERIDRTA